MNIYVVRILWTGRPGSDVPIKQCLRKKDCTENNHEILLDNNTFFFMFISRKIKKS